MWLSKKRSRRQHIQGPDGRTMCQLENGGARTDTISDRPDPDRAMCKLCLDLQRTGKRDQPPTRSKGASGQKYRRRVQGQHYHQGPTGEAAWKRSPLGRRFQYLLDFTD